MGEKEERLMSDTIFYKAKLKRTATPETVFEKLRKKVGKKGPTQKWECSFDIDESAIQLDFHDEMSETFIMKLNPKSVYEGFCKVFFDMPGDVLDKPSELKELLDIFYGLKSQFSILEFSDDYGLVDGYWDSKRFQFAFRELTEEENARVEKWFRAGFESHEKLLRAIMAEDMGMTYEEFLSYDNPDSCAGENIPRLEQELATYFYETAEFQKEGRVSENWMLYITDPGKHTFSLWSFIEGMEWIFCDGSGTQREITLDKHRCMMPALSQIDLIYREKFAPAFLGAEDSLERCKLAYRYFLSAYEFTGFHFVGR